MPNSAPRLDVSRTTLFFSEVIDSPLEKFILGSQKVLVSYKELATLQQKYFSTASPPTRGFWKPSGAVA
jgi:hypothetical protein